MLPTLNIIKKHILKKWGGWSVTQLLRVLAALSEDLRSAPSTQISQFTTAWNSSFRRSNALSGLCRHQHMAHTYTQIDHTNKRKSNLKVARKQGMAEYT